ncbi:MAG TPA: hypothetical protein VFS32_04705 [Candidatus Limnocylindrales bacterium]|nr:hypothetical protein [Candidatus Limnocylindrales bacterium]
MGPPPRCDRAASHAHPRCHDHPRPHSHRATAAHGSGGQGKHEGGFVLVLPGAVGAFASFRRRVRIVRRRTRRRAA